MKFWLDAPDETADKGDAACAAHGAAQPAQPSERQLEPPNASGEFTTFTAGLRGGGAAAAGGKSGDGAPYDAGEPIGSQLSTCRGRCTLLRRRPAAPAPGAGDGTTGGLDGCGLATSASGDTFTGSCEGCSCSDARGSSSTSIVVCEPSPRDPGTCLSGARCANSSSPMRFHTHEVQSACDGPFLGQSTFLGDNLFLGENLFLGGALKKVPVLQESGAL